MLIRLQIPIDKINFNELCCRIVVGDKTVGTLYNIRDGFAHCLISSNALIDGISEYSFPVNSIFFDDEAENDILASKKYITPVIDFNKICRVIKGDS